MSSELDSMYISLQNNQVPANWDAVAYPSLKPLGSWFKDLIERVKVIEDWLVNGPASGELPSFRARRKAHYRRSGSSVG